MRRHRGWQATACPWLRCASTGQSAKDGPGASDLWGSVGEQKDRAMLPPTPFRPKPRPSIPTGRTPKPGQFTPIGPIRSPRDLPQNPVSHPDRPRNQPDPSRPTGPEMCPCAVTLRADAVAALHPGTEYRSTQIHPPTGRPRGCPPEPAEGHALPLGSGPRLPTLRQPPSGRSLGGGANVRGYGTAGGSPWTNQAFCFSSRTHSSTSSTITPSRKGT